jgi:hypothetical protein
MRPAEKIGEARVRPQRIPTWIQFEAHASETYCAFLIALFQPLECLVLLSEGHIDLSHGQSWHKPVPGELVQLIEDPVRLGSSTHQRIAFEGEDWLPNNPKRRLEPDGTVPSIYLWCPRVAALLG